MLRIRTLKQSNVSPVTLAAARTWVRQDEGVDDEVIASLILAARQQVETITKRSVMLRTVQVTGGSFDLFDRLPAGPLLSMDSVQYYDETNTLQTLSAAGYTVAKVGEPAELILEYAQAWPATVARDDAVKATMRCGMLTPVTVPLGSPTDEIGAVGHAFESGDVVHYYAFDGDPWFGMTHGAQYMVDGVGSDAITLVDVAGVKVEPTEVSGAVAAVHCLGTVDERVRVAMRMLIGHWYQNRSAVEVGTIATEVPVGVRNVLAGLKAFRF